MLKYSFVNGALLKGLFGPSSALCACKAVVWCLFIFARLVVEYVEVANPFLRLWPLLGSSSPEYMCARYGFAVGSISPVRAFLDRDDSCSSGRRSIMLKN